MENEIWKKLFGFEVGHEMKKMVLAEVAKTGDPIEKVIAQRTLPEMAIINEQGLFQYEGRMITPEEWRKINPLGQYGRIVIVHQKDL